jgi:hypothetical protein
MNFYEGGNVDILKRARKMGTLSISECLIAVD